MKVTVTLEICYTHNMSDMEKRLHRVIVNMTGAESLAASLDEDAAGELLLWGEAAAKKIVDETEGMDDESAEEMMAPRLRALRLMLRALGRWVGEAKSLDIEARQALWNRAGEQARALNGDSYIFPSMDETLEQIPADANNRQTVIWLRTFIEE
jgi:hypothetical protein